MSETAESAMPKTDSPKMIEITFAVPEAMLNDALDMAQAEGWKRAEMHRLFWVQGFAAHAEASNKRYINRRLRRKAATEDVELEP